MPSKAKSKGELALSLVRELIAATHAFQSRLLPDDNAEILAFVAKWAADSKELTPTQMSKAVAIVFSASGKDSKQELASIRQLLSVVCDRLEKVANGQAVAPTAPPTGVEDCELPSETRSSDVCDRPVGKRTGVRRQAAR